MAFRVSNVEWKNNKRVLSKLREQVFVYEWHIPRECEFDTRDINAHHVLIISDDNIEVATGRITADGELGRIAVMPKYRQAEVYRKLLNALLGIAKKEGIKEIFIQCELNAVKHYRQQGFDTVGAVYMDAGIARQRMSKLTVEMSPNELEHIH